MRKFVRKQLIKIVRWAAFKLLFPLVYARATKQPVQGNKVLFLEGKLNDLPDAYIKLWEYLEQNTDYNLEYYSAQQVRSSYKEYYQRCITLLEKLGQAKYVFLNDASDIVSCLKLRPETFVCNLWHACGAFKKWGMSNADGRWGGVGRLYAETPVL